MADLVHLSSSASSEEIIDVLPNKDAGVIIDNLLHSDDISESIKILTVLKNDVFGRMNLLDSKEKSWGINCKI